MLVPTTACAGTCVSCETAVNLGLDLPPNSDVCRTEFGTVSMYIGYPRRGLVTIVTKMWTPIRLLHSLFSDTDAAVIYGNCCGDFTLHTQAMSRLGLVQTIAPCSALYK